MNRKDAKYAKKIHVPGGLGGASDNYGNTKAGILRPHRASFASFASLRLVVGLFLLLAPFSAHAAPGWQWIAPQRVMSLVKEGSGLWLVDVRCEAAFAESHVEGAVNIPAGLLGTKRLPKGKIIVLVDDSLGLRKGREAAETLLKNGHDKIYLLEGGIRGCQGEGLTVTGKGTRQYLSGVMPDDIKWAEENHIPLRILDLRDKSEQEHGAVPQAQAVDGKNWSERLEKAKALAAAPEKKGLAAKLEKPPTTVLVFPSGVDPRPVMERAFRGSLGDIRYLEGGYAAWAAKPDKSINTVGVCPTCPKGAPGGKK